MHFTTEKRGLIVDIDPSQSPACPLCGNIKTPPLCSYLPNLIMTKKTFQVGTLLTGKNAVIYGAGGAIGGAVARAFAREGATVFLTGRGPRALESLAEEIRIEGGKAEAALVDALDEDSISNHLRHVVTTAGSIDISFNAVGMRNATIIGTPLVDLDVNQFSRPLTEYATSYFLTARLAARHMIPRKTGVIMTVTALLSRSGAPLVGSYGPAMAAKEALTRGLSAELAPHGIRVVGLRPQAMPETRQIREAFEPRQMSTGMTWEQWQTFLASKTHPRRLMTLEELANMAVLVASDKASGMMGTIVNLTMGTLDD
jgi:NAD(P)-dependent dehydrogenase (short-subunit alcohol dehydrogenase family)